MIAEDTLIDYSKISDIEFDGIDYKDYPDFCDAYILSAKYNGKPVDGELLGILNEDRDFVYEKLIDKLF